MKNLLFVLIFLSNISYAQNLEILLIGASHDYSKAAPQDFSKVHQKIRQFKPDAFFGEYRSKEDERLLINYWCKSFNNERIERLKAKRPIAEKDLPKVIADLKAKITQNPNDWKARIDIAHAYYLDQDVANARFQVWQAFHDRKIPANEEIFQYSKLVFPPEIDSLYKAIKTYNSSEYDNIAYPMMIEMELKEVYPMDCQVYDLNYSTAVDSFWSKYDAFQKDTIEGYNAAFKKLAKPMYAAQKGWQSREKTDKYFTEYMNTDESGKINLTYDYMVSEMYDFKGFPKVEVLSAIHWWNMRNEGMCQNTIERAKKLGIKKIVIIVGANHRMGMQAIFEKMPNVKVWNINAFGK